MRDIDAEIRAYDAKVPAEMEARRAVDAALACVPPDAGVLRRYAGMRFDSTCGETAWIICRCAYCDARRALVRLAGDSSGVNPLTPDAGEVGR